MQKTIYKSLLLSLLITNIWAVVTFFIYFHETPGLFSGFKTLFFFIGSCWISSGLGLLIILLSFIKIKKSDQIKVFLLVLAFWFNIFFSILLVITGFLEIITSSSYIDAFLIVNFIIPIVTFFILRNKTRQHKFLILAHNDTLQN